MRYRWQALVSLGALELAAGDAATAADVLLAARRVADANGIAHAAALVPLVDEVEAAVEAGRREQALAAFAALRAHRCETEWAEPLRLRAAAFFEVDGDAEALLERAVALGDAALPVDRGRTLLALGTVQRRRRRRRVARETLESAVELFDAVGAALWVGRARSELSRIGGRPARSSGLTPSEERVAQLVAEGRTNKEVAAILVIAERTVESALTQIYRKLEIRSRTELARRLDRAAF